MKLLDKNLDLGLLAIRISIGVLMLLHGISKLINGIGFIENQVREAGLPAIVANGVYIGEIIAPLFIILGYGTRLAAGVLVINCIVAALLVHTSDLISLNTQGGWVLELLGLYFWGALALFFAGGGKYALSHKYLWD